MFWDTGKGCLAALVLYSVAVTLLVMVFLLFPESIWLHLLLSLAVFTTVTQYVYAVDEKSKRNNN